MAMPKTTELRPLMEVRPGAMRSPGHTLLLWPYLLGQYRVQVTRADKPDALAPPGGHGQIVREMCTYNRDKALKLMVLLSVSGDPEALCRSLERPWNCDGPGGRIRLDNKPGDRR